MVGFFMNKILNSYVFFLKLTSSKGLISKWAPGRTHLIQTNFSEIVNTVADGEPLHMRKRGSAEGEILAPSFHIKLYRRHHRAESTSRDKTLVKPSNCSFCCLFWFFCWYSTVGWDEGKALNGICMRSHFLLSLETRKRRSSNTERITKWLWQKIWSLDWMQSTNLKISKQAKANPASDTPPLHDCMHSLWDLQCWMIFVSSCPGNQLWCMKINDVFLLHRSYTPFSTNREQIVLSESSKGLTPPKSVLTSPNTNTCHIQKKKKNTPGFPLTPDLTVWEGKYKEYSRGMEMLVRLALQLCFWGWSSMKICLG